MNGDGRGVLKQHIPELYEPLLDSKQLKSRVDKNPVNAYRRGFHGILPQIRKKIHQENNIYWLRQKLDEDQQRCADWLLNKPSYKCKETKTKLSIKITGDSAAFLQDLKVGLMF